MRLYKTILNIHNQVFMCLHVDSRFPICSDYCKTLIKLHGNFGQVIIPFKMEGQKQQQQQKFLDCTCYYSNEPRGNPG